MRKIVMTIVCYVLWMSPAFSGGDHEHGHDDGHGHAHESINADQATKKATGKLQSLVKRGKIDKSWTDVISSAKAEKKTFSKGPEWVITFNNSKISDKSKQTLYMFYSMDGHYIAANYSGT